MTCKYLSIFQVLYIHYANTMGHDLIAYFNISQEDIESFINENDINRNDWRSSEELIIKYFIDEYIMEQDREYFSTLCNLSYSWNDELKLHTISSRYNMNFLKEDTRFENVYFKTLLEKKVGKPMPYILRDKFFCMKSASDAREAAEAINDFFPDDEQLMWFREWLLKTEMYTVLYDLSY